MVLMSDKFISLRERYDKLEEFVGHLQPEPVAGEARSVWFQLVANGFQQTDQVVSVFFFHRQDSFQHAS